MPKYHSISTIPAKTFFQILETKDYQLLKPKPREKGLQEVFIAIYDDFFLKSDNFEAKEYLKVTKEVAFLEHKIGYLKQALHFYYYNKTTKEMRLSFIEALKQGYDIEIDVNKPFSEEVLRVMTIEIGIIQNDLTSAKITYDGMIKKSKQKAFDYEEQIVNLENVIKRSIADEIMLDKYIAYEKSAQKIISQLNKKAA